MIHKMDHNHFHIICIGFVEVVPIGEFAIKILSALHKIDPFFSRILCHYKQLIQCISPPQLYIWRWQTLDAMKPKKLGGYDMTHDSKYFFIAHRLSFYAIQYAFVRPGIIVVKL